MKRIKGGKVVTRAKMADPNTVVCRNCFRCIQECPRGALEKSLDKDFLNIGGSYWKSDIFITLWKQAEDGKVPVTVPVTGARLPDQGLTACGPICRKLSARHATEFMDGIHQHIRLKLGRKLNHLTFDEKGKLLSKIHDTVDIPIP